MREWPLILFTLLTQAAAGLVTLSSLLLLLVEPDQSASLSAAGRLALPLLLVGTAASFAHLGTPPGGLRTLANLRSSWMSREVLLLCLLGCGATGFFALWQWWPAEIGLIRLVGVVTSLVGLATVYATGMVYRLPTRPEWNHWSTLATGFGTAFLLASLLLAALAPSISPVGGLLLGWVVLAALALLLISTASHALYLRAVSRSSAMWLFGSAWFWVRLLLGVPIPLLTALLWLQGTHPPAHLVAIALVVASGGELIGRSLFYEIVFRRLPTF